jgi:hypothetical protein
MKESSTYQAILEEGRSEGALAETKKLLRQWGEDAFGAPNAKTAAAIERLNDLTQLEDLLRRVHSVTSWQELLGPPVGGSRKGRRRPSA